MKYRKKPVVIEARQFDGTYQCARSLLAWMLYDCYDCSMWHYSEVDNFCDELKITTLEGVHSAKKGDYIIKGVKGEFYPCKPDIFEMTYEPVE